VNKREAITTVVLALLATMSAIAVPLMAEASTKIIIGTGLVSFAGTGTSLLVALGLDPRSKFGGGGNGAA
jgi:hypothetical protein